MGKRRLLEDTYVNSYVPSKIQMVQKFAKPSLLT